MLVEEAGPGAIVYTYIDLSTCTLNFSVLAEEGIRKERTSEVAMSKVLKCFSNGLSSQTMVG